MHIRRSLPSTGWYAVLALAFVAALGAATVVGAGLSLWRGSAAQRAVGLPSDPLLRPGSGVVTVPVRPAPAPNPSQAAGRTLTRVVGVGPGRPSSTPPSSPAPSASHARTSHAPGPSPSHPAPPPSSPAPPPSPPALAGSSGPPAWAHLGANARAHVSAVLARVHPPGLVRQLTTASPSSWPWLDESPAAPGRRSVKAPKPPKSDHAAVLVHEKLKHGKPGHEKPQHEKHHDDD